MGRIADYQGTLGITSRQEISEAAKNSSVFSTTQVIRVPLTPHMPAVLAITAITAQPTATNSKYTKQDARASRAGTNRNP
jgi:hypothetical protein